MDRRRLSGQSQNVVCDVDDDDATAEVGDDSAYF